MPDSLCWYCDRPYSLALDTCPHCKAANGNADLPRANAQALEPRQALRLAAEVAERKFADHMENP